MKQNEFISIEFFIDAENNKDPLTVHNYPRRMNLNYRIANLNSIHIFDYKDIKPSKNLKLIKNLIPTFLGFLLFLSFSIAGLVSGIKSFTSPKLTVNHELIFQPTGEQIDELKTLGEKVLLLNFHDQIIDTLTFENAKHLITLKPKFITERNKYSLLALSIILTFAFLFGAFLMTKETIDDIKMNNILKKIKNS